MKPFPRVILIFAVVMISCQQDTRTEEQKRSDLDSFSRVTYGESAADHIKKMKDSAMRNVYIDTVGLSKAPIKILKAKVVKREYSSYRDVYLYYKNVSKKTIVGIKFRWYGTNAFNEPADLGNYSQEGFGGGFTDDVLKAGRSDNGTWNVLSKDAKTIKLAWPIEVSFSDGTMWNIGSK